MKRALAAFAVTALTVALAACPRGGAGGSAEPAQVEIDWPDAGVVVAPVDAGPVAD